jgi:hypothetical protein
MDSEAGVDAGDAVDKLSTDAVDMDEFGSEAESEADCKAESDEESDVSWSRLA